MKQCPKCQAEISDTAKFCPKCGFNIKKYEEESSLKDAFCSECGAEIGDGNEFCSECGKKVNSLIDPTPGGDPFNDEWLSDLKGVTATNVIKQKVEDTKEQTRRLLSAYEYEEHVNGTYTITGLADKNALSVVIPKGVESIGVEAFANTNIMQVTLPDGLMVIDTRAFYNCKRLNQVNFPESLVFIGDEAFMGCSDLNITYPNIKKIGENAFCGTETDIHEKRIAAQVDHDDMELMNRQFHVEKMSDGSYRIIGVKDIRAEVLYISSKISCIDMTAFSECRKLKEISVSERNPNYQSIDGVLYERAMVYVPPKIAKSFDLPVGVRLSTNLKGCENVTSVVIPENITVIADYMFQDCVNLETVILHEKITEIGIEAFKNCKKLKDIKLPKSLTSIGAGAFSGCCSLRQIFLPEQLRMIPDYCFANCSDIGEVVFSKTLQHIGIFAFSGCVSLNEIDLPSELRYIGQQAFANCSFNTVFIPQSVSCIGDGAFLNCKSANVKRGTKALFKDGFSRNCIVNIY